MSVVVIAGGSGDLGRLITEAVFETAKHEVYSMSRNKTQHSASSSRISPLTGAPYDPFIQTDYTSEESLTEILVEKRVNVVICAFIMDCEAVSESQLRLIRAADQASTVTRFIPSEFNVEYDVDDSVLPYPEKKFHMAARQELSKTSTLEYTYIYPGMFMDYFGQPRVESSLRPLCFFIDPMNGLAVLPDDGEAKMSMSFTTDAARYLALALDLESWPRVMTTTVSTITLNELVRLVEACQGLKMEVRYQPVQNLLDRNAIDLPTNLDIARQYPERFPGGLSQLRGLIADLEAGVALGAYDFDRMSDAFSLVEAFRGRTVEPRSIHDLITEAWKPV